MKTGLLLTAVGVALAAGCAAQREQAPLAQDHPANPQAAEAPLYPGSSTLAVSASEPPPVGGGAGPAGGMDQRGQGMDHRGHGAAGSQMPAPIGPGTAQPMPATTPATAPALAGTLYACPMHPEITSTNPNDRCPKCKMKINKPVKPAGAGAPAGTAPPTGGPAGQGSQPAHRHGEETK